MITLPTVLLRHDSPEGLHHDWLLSDPRLADDPDSLLWTARVGPSSHQWEELGTWDIEPIRGHRRHYLTYEGPLTNGRGNIHRVDEGTISSTLWTDNRIIFNLMMRYCQGCVELVRLSASHWRARLVEMNEPPADNHGHDDS